MMAGYIVQFRVDLLRKGLAGALLMACAAAHAAPFAYIPGGGAVTVIDTATSSVTATVPIGGNLAPPYRVYIHPSGSPVYIEGATGGIAVIDANSNTIVNTLNIGNAVLSPAGDKFYAVGYNGAQQIGVIDAASGALLTTIPVGYLPGALTFNASGTRAYVVSLNSLGQVPALQVIDAQANAVIARVSVSQTQGTAGYPGNASAPVAFPFSVAVDPAGARVYVLDAMPCAGGQPGLVWAIDASTNAVLTTIPAGVSSPAQPSATGVLPPMVLDPSGSHLVVTNTTSNTLSIIDTATYNVITYTPAEGSIVGATMSPIGKGAYVSTIVPTPGAPNEGFVLQVDPTNGYVTEVFQVGADPSIPEVTPAGSRIYVLDPASSEAYILDIQNPFNQGTSSLSPVAVGSDPQVAGGAFIGPAGTVSQYPLTINIIGNGSVSGPPWGINCTPSTQPCISLQPALTELVLAPVWPPGSQFAGWSSNCGLSNYCDITMTGPQTITVNFIPICPYTAQSGWWWNPAEGGRGYFIDNQQNSLYFAALVYDSSGNDTWYVASGASPTTPNCTFSGTLQTFGGGQTLTGVYRSPTSASTLGNVSITFSDASHAIASFPGETVALQRYLYTSGPTTNTQATYDQATGIYWNPAEGGRGFGIEVQNGVLYMVGWMYDGTGRPVWYAAGPTTESLVAQREAPRSRITGIGPPPPPPPPFFAQWVEYTGGQSFVGPYRSPSVLNADSGSMTLQFQTQYGGAATLTLPNGAQIPLQHYVPGQ
jgi:YVTN family beta-propeller protein